MKTLLRYLLLFGSLSLLSCGTSNTKYSEKEIALETRRINNFFAKKFEEEVNRYPEYQTYLGRKTNYDKLNDYSEEYEQEEYSISEQNLKELEGFDRNKLTPEARLSFDLYKRSTEKYLKNFKWRYHYYPVNQMFGVQSDLVSFMINQHQMEVQKHASDYISRVKEFKTVLLHTQKRMEKSASKKIVPPKFVFPKVISDLDNIIQGAPFTKTGKNPLYSDFESKVNKLKIFKSQKQKLKKQMQQVLLSDVKPAIENFKLFIVGLQGRATDAKGVWSLPDGDEYYQVKLNSYTTTDYSPEKIHQIGLSEVKRIHKEMESIKARVNFKGSLNQFFTHIKNSSKFYYPNTASGRKSYLTKTNKIIAKMKRKLPKLFNVLPKAKLTVKPVEAFREKSAGRAFYNGPALDGSRPGIYYVNLSNLKGVPKYEMEALAYHEAVPGHHMQIAIAQELKTLPMFRRMMGFTAYSEGWGLYAELLPKEIGFYKNPYSDFGRLSMELWRACRLVVDTGIHFKKWSKEKAISYLNQNAPNAEDENIRAIERYFVMPGQATAYKIGQLKILELREKWKKQLGSKFDIKKFHDAVLKDGALPLDVLEARVDSQMRL